MMSPRDHSKAVGFIGCWRKSKTSRPPRALTNATRADAIKGIQDGGNVAAHETCATLYGVEIVAKADL